MADWNKRPCPKCGGRMRPKSKQCAKCRGYGTYRTRHATGYIRLWRPGHPLAAADGYVMEHRFVVHQAGIEIPDGHHVHHVNGDRTDNRLENLRVLPAATHAREHIQAAGTITNQFGTFPLRTERPCEACGTPFMPWMPASRYCTRSCANRAAAAIRRSRFA